MRIYEIIGNWLLNSDIVTEASDRSMAMDRIENLIQPVTKHLI